MDTRQKFTCAKCGKPGLRKDEREDYCQRCKKFEARFSDDTPPLCEIGVGEVADIVIQVSG